MVKFAIVLMVLNYACVVVDLLALAATGEQRFIFYALLNLVVAVFLTCMLLLVRS